MKSAASRIALASTLLLAACGGANARVSSLPDGAARGPAGDYPMVLGEPFVIDGITYTPADTLNYDSVGQAQRAADGALGAGITGAHRTLPLPSYVEVTSLETGRTILVRLTKRGPMTGSDLLALSPAAWNQLGAPQSGRVAVRVRRVNPPEAERALLRSGGEAPARMDTPPGLLAALRRKLGAVAAPAPITDSSPVAAVTAAAQAKNTPAPKPAARPATQANRITASEAPAAAKPEPRPTAAANAAPAIRPESGTAAKAERGLFVQVGAYSTRARAEGVARTVGGSVSPAGKFWRVRVGPHDDRGQADAALAKVHAQGYADARIMTAP
ncbi:MAG: RlpA-like double-psi beta-barrel domain-containing protein [Novosphingobium sp.]